MTRKAPARKQTSRSAPARIAWLAGSALAIVLLAGIWFVSRQPAESGPGTLGPQLAVSAERLDLGTLPFNQLASATFKLTNEGDRTLQLDASTPVRVLEGC